MLTIAHIFHSTPQDNSAVVAVMSDVISQLKVIMPALKTFYYREDSAGCDHCNPWPPVAPRFFRSARRQGHR